MSRRVLSLILTGALLGGTIVCGNPTAATADPTYPSWADVRAARGNADATAARIADIETLIASLGSASDTAGQRALEAGERAQVADEALAEAATQADDLEARLDRARRDAAGAKRYLGAAAAALARTGSHGAVETLVSTPAHTDDLLYRLGALEKVTGIRNESAIRARQALGEVESLSAQSAVVEDKRAEAARAQRRAATEAESAATAAEAAVAEQREHGAELGAQLTVLRDRTANLEEQYRVGEAARVEAERQASAARAAAAAQAAADRRATERAAATRAAQRAGVAAHGSSERSGSTGHHWRPAPHPRPVPASPRPEPAVPAPAPAGAAASAVRFARAQLGLWYRLGGEGPSTWDCSGLTMIAYRQAGVYIGYHTVGAQYRYLSAAGRLASASDGLQPGDLLFYNRGSSTVSSSMYHVTMYVGHGQMIEAPQPGQRVKISPVRTHNLVPFVGRPA